MAQAGVASGRNTPSDYEQTGFRLSWGAIVAGLVVAVMLQVIFSLLGLAIGLASWEPGEGIGNLSTAAGIWAGLSALVALGVGGVTTGRLAGVLTKGDGALHGVVLWGLTMLVGFWLILNGAGFLLGNVFSILGETVSTVAGSATSGVVAAGGAAIGGAGSIDYAALEREVQAILRDTGDPALAPDSLTGIADTAGARLTEGTADTEAVAEDVIDRLRQRAGEVDRQDILNVVAARTDLSPAEAERVADRVESAASSLRSQVAAEVDTLRSQAGAGLRAGARTAADWGATGAWWTLLVLVLSGGAAAAGGAVTARS